MSEPSIDDLTAEFIGEDPDLEAASEVLAGTGERDYAEPDSKFIEKDNRGPVAKTYEKKVRKVLNGAMRVAVQHEETLADGAALIMYAPQIAEKTGDLANTDKRVRRAVDWITEGTENPYLSFAFATMPLVLQLYRNHQDQIAPTAIVQTVKQRRQAAKEQPGRTFRIPFTKRTITIRFRFRGVDNLTNDPVKLTDYVFQNQDILAALERAEIRHVYGANGHPTVTPPNRQPNRRRSR